MYTYNIYIYNIIMHLEPEDLSEKRMEPKHDF